MTKMSQAGSAAGLETWVPFSRTMSTWSVRSSFLPPGALCFSMSVLFLCTRPENKVRQVLSCHYLRLGYDQSLAWQARSSPSPIIPRLRLCSLVPTDCSTSPILQGLMSRSGRGEGICRLQGDAGVISGPQFMNHCHRGFKHDLIYKISKNDITS